MSNPDKTIDSLDEILVELYLGDGFIKANPKGWDGQLKNPILIKAKQAILELFRTSSREARIDEVKNMPLRIKAKIEELEGNSSDEADGAWYLKYTVEDRIKELENE